MKVLSVNGRDVSLKDLVEKVRSCGRASVLKPIVHQIIIEEYAGKRNLTASDQELQEEFDNFRKARGLYTAEDTVNLMEHNGISIDIIEKDMEIKVLGEKIKSSIPRETIEKFFAENRAGMDAVELYILTVKEQEVALELLAQLKEEEANFMVLAGEYSTDSKAKMGGYIGMVSRPELKADIAAAVFGAQPGDVIGPFEGEEGYNLIKVNALYPARLDEKKEKEIRNILFNGFLSDAEQKAKIEWAK